MKGIKKEQLEETRPQQIDAEEGLDFCLNALYADKKHTIEEYVVHNLTYEELIGALLLARDTVKEHQRCLEEE
jgi:hypothetical protein